MNHHIGIVLKTCYGDLPSITVLDKQLGKINGKVAAKNKNIRTCNGSIIQYSLIQLRSSYVFDIIDLESVPVCFKPQDIFFLHHVLELCYYFLPIGCAIDDVFIFLQNLFQLKDNKNLYIKRHIILAHLFSLFGMYPEHAILSKYLEKLLGKPLASILESPTNAKVDKYLDLWIQACITEHPHRKQFKTVWLLKKANTYEH